MTAKKNSSFVILRTSRSKSKSGMFVDLVMPDGKVRAMRRDAFESALSAADTKARAVTTNIKSGRFVGAQKG